MTNKEIVKILVAKGGPGSGRYPAGSGSSGGGENKPGKDWAKPNAEGKHPTFYDNHYRYIHDPKTTKWHKLDVDSGKHMGVISHEDMRGRVMSGENNIEHVGHLNWQQGWEKDRS